MNWYYLNEAGEVAGPVSDSTLAELRAINRLADNAQVCREGSEDWISLAEALRPNMIIPEKPAEAAAPSRQLTPKKKNSPKGALIAMIGGVMIAAGTMIFFFTRSNEVKSSEKSEFVTEARSEAPTSKKETENKTPTLTSESTQRTDAKDSKKKESANPTDSKEQYYIGMDYSFGTEDRPKDLKKAAVWFEKSALQGHQPAQIAIGLAYYEGKGVPVDYHKAAHWFTVLAEQGWVAAQDQLGRLHLSGQLGEVNAIEAYKWLDLASRGENLKEAEESAKWRNLIAAQMNPAQLKEAKELVRKWKKKSYKELVETGTTNPNYTSPSNNGDAASFDGQDVQTMLRAKYPNDAKLRSRAMQGLQLIINGNPSVSPADALETLEGIRGGSFTNEADAYEAYRKVEKLLDAAAYIGMTGEDILNATIASQLRIRDQLDNSSSKQKGDDSEDKILAAGMAYNLVVNAALASKMERESVEKANSLGMELRPPRSFEDRLKQEENAQLEFYETFPAIVMLVGGRDSMSPGGQKSAEQIISAFKNTDDRSEKERLDEAARKLILREFQPSAKLKKPDVSTSNTKSTTQPAFSINAALPAFAVIKSASIDEARECVRLLDEQLKQDPGNTRIQKVRSTIMDIFREEALLVAAKAKYIEAEKLLVVEQRNLAITSKPSALSGRVNHDEVARTRGKVNAAQTAIKNAKKQGEESRSNLQKLLNEALSGLPEEERKALSPVWQQVAKRHQINLKK
jgi:TPR repeat protein